MVSLLQLVATAIVPSIPEGVADTLRALLSKSYVRADVAADNSAFQYLSTWTDRVTNIFAKTALEHFVMEQLLAAGLTENGGYPKLNAPVIIPFNTDENGNPTTQLRMFVYKARPKSPDEITVPSYTLRLEPFGVKSAFEVREQQQVAQAA